MECSTVYGAYVSAQTAPYRSLLAFVLSAGIDCWFLIIDC